MKKYRSSVKIVGGIIIVTLSLLVILTGLEVYFRLQGQYGRSLFEYDPNLIWRTRDNYRGTKTWGDEHFPLEFNNQGFRGRAYEKEKKPGVTRIMVIGDSYTAGMDVRVEDLYTTQLEGLLNEKAGEGRSFEVYNAGCPAWGTDQEYIFWKTEGIAFQPDYLVLMVAPNDVREMYMKKLVVLQGDEVVVNPVKYPRKARMGWWLSNHSSFYQYLQAEYLDTHYGHFYDIFEHYPVNFGKGDSTNWDLPLFLREPYPEVAEARQLFKTLVAGINASAESVGCKMVLSIIPTKMEYDGSLDSTQYQPGAIAALTAEVADQENILFLNLYEDVKQSTDPMVLFLSWDFHMNKEGNAYLAEKLADFFLQSLIF